jgi:methionine-rich copper-binding protein CopC
MRALARTFSAAIAVVASLSGHAMAHAHLVSAVPPVGGVVKAAPANLELHFSEAVNLTFSGVEVTGARSGVLSTGKTVLKAGDDATLVVPLLGAPAADTYTVSWHALSADGHKVKGVYSFAIKP